MSRLSFFRLNVQLFNVLGFFLFEYTIKQLLHSIFA